MYNKKLYLYNHFGYSSCEKIYSVLLKLCRNTKRFPIITENELNKIKEIAKDAFPKEMQHICELESVSDLLDYCHCYRKEQIYYILTDEWYFVLVAHHNCYELVECADKNRKCNDVFKIVNYVIKNFTNKPIISTCRESTSLPLFLMFEKHKRISILNDIVGQRDGETIHNIKFKVIKKAKKRRDNKLC